MTAPTARPLEVEQAVEEPYPTVDAAAEEAPGPSKTDGAKRKARPRKKTEDAPVEPKPARRKTASTPTPEPSNEDAPTGPRRGWWQRTFG